MSTTTAPFAHPSALSPSSTISKMARRFLPFTVGLLIVILLVSAAARMAGITNAMALDVIPFDDENLNYVNNLLPILLHIAGGVVFTLLGAIQFVPQIRNRWPALHRWLGRFIVVAALFAGASSLYMNEVFPPVGGALKYSSNLIFGVGMIATILASIFFIVRGDVEKHRAYMMRAYAVALGVGTQRLVLMPIYFATGEMTETMIGVGVWIGWLINFVVVETILWRRRQTRA